VNALRHYLLEEDVERVSKRKYNAVPPVSRCAITSILASIPVQKHLILLSASNNIEHDV
jgi:hypothetical protein